MGSGRVPGMWDPGEYQKCGIWASTRKVGSGQVPEMWDLGKYQKGNIRVSTGKGRIWASTRNVGSGRVPGMWDPGEYQKCGNWASTRNMGSGRVPERVEIRVSTGSGRNPGEMLENPEQAKRSKQTQGKVVGPSMTSRVYQQMTRIS